MINLVRLLRWPLLLSLVWAFSISPVYADSNTVGGQGISISPAQTPISALPGGTATGNVDVINSGTGRLSVSTYVDPYFVSGVNYTPNFVQLPGTKAPSKWVTINGPTSFYIAPTKSVAVPYTLNVPAATTPGGYYAVIFAETKSTSSSGIASQSRVGDILYITVEGPVVQQGSLLHVPIQHLVFGSTLDLASEVKNSGGLHFIANVHMQLVNPITKRVAFNSSAQRYVLPQTIRKITLPADLTSLIGIYKYKVSAGILGHTQTLPSQWVVLVKPLALVYFFIIVVLIVIYFRLPKRKKTKNKKK